MSLSRKLTFAALCGSVLFIIGFAVSAPVKSYFLLDEIDNLERNTLNNITGRAEKYALQGVNVTLKAGERLAVVGLNGAGKSTFIKLLLRLVVLAVCPHMIAPDAAWVVVGEHLRCPDALHLIAAEGHRRLPAFLLGALILQQVDDGHAQLGLTLSPRPCPAEHQHRPQRKALT